MAFKKAQLNRADILIAHKKGDRKTAGITAKKLGLHYIEPEKKQADLQIEPATPNPEENKQNFQKDPKLTTVIRPLEGFWYLKKRKINKKHRLKEKPAISIDQVIWRNRPSTAPRHQLLAPPREILARLEQHLFLNQATRRIDLDKASEKISRGEVLNKLPRKSKKQAVQQIHILEDRQRYLTPYWKDHKIIKTLMPAYFYQCQFSHSILLNADTKPDKTIVKNIAPNSTVIILSDLGLLAQNNKSQTQRWLQIGRELKRKNCKACVLLPCEIERCHPKLKQLFKLISWEQNKNKQADSKKHTEQLLTALSPAIRIEPSLLRNLRLEMQQYGEEWQIPAAVESLFWQHADIQDPHSTAATWIAEKRQQRLIDFESLSEAQRNTCLSVIRGWRSKLHQQIWFEEVISLQNKSQKLGLIRDDIDDAQQYFSAFNQTLNNQQTSIKQSKTCRWFKRLEQRLPENSIEKSPDLQRISASLHKDDKDFNAKLIDPRNLIARDAGDKKKEIKRAVIYQQGEKIGIKLHQANKPAEMGQSHLALIDMREEHLQIRVNNKAEGALNLNNHEPIALPKNTSEYTLI